MKGVHVFAEGRDVYLFKPTQSLLTRIYLTLGVPGVSCDFQRISVETPETVKSSNARGKESTDRQHRWFSYCAVRPCSSQGAGIREVVSVNIATAN